MVRLLVEQPVDQARRLVLRAIRLIGGVQRCQQRQSIKCHSLGIVTIRTIETVHRLAVGQRPLLVGFVVDVTKEEPQRIDKPRLSEPSRTRDRTSIWTEKPSLIQGTRRNVVARFHGRNGLVRPHRNLSENERSMPFENLISSTARGLQTASGQPQAQCPGEQAWQIHQDLKILALIPPGLGICFEAYMSRKRTTAAGRKRSVRGPRERRQYPQLRPLAA